MPSLVSFVFALDRSLCSVLRVMRSPGSCSRTHPCECRAGRNPCRRHRHRPQATISDTFIYSVFCGSNGARIRRCQPPPAHACSFPTRREHCLLKASRLSFLLITKHLSSPSRSRWHRGAVPGKASLPRELGVADARGVSKHKAEKRICVPLLLMAFLSGIFSCLSTPQKDWPQLHGEHHSFHGLDVGQVAWEWGGGGVGVGVEGSGIAWERRV